ncbi:MAG: YdcF family protein [Patescibacteria group bacterium]
MNQEEIDSLAKIIWDYHHMNHQLKNADCLFVLGSHDTRVAEYAADLFLQGLASYIIFSGGLGRLTTNIFRKPEAEIFADIALAKGISKNKIIIENQSTNTGENVQFTREILKQKGLNFNSFILVQKPYMERRTYATFKKIWPEKKLIVTSPKIDFTDYPNNEISKERVINIMVGDLQRIKIYPKRGFQIFQEIPKNVWEAYERLIECGFTAHLINE